MIDSEETGLTAALFFFTFCFDCSIRLCACNAPQNGHPGEHHSCYVCFANEKLEYFEARQKREMSKCLPVANEKH